MTVTEPTARLNAACITPHLFEPKDREPATVNVSGLLKGGEERRSNRAAVMSTVAAAVSFVKQMFELISGSDRGNAATASVMIDGMPRGGEFWTEASE
ncbi:MAG: hypothetical protein OES24_01525 [Acidimicrobiia bacterium]|nr:hypothetical protein [Acidimicrobiia bacterium]